MNEFNAENIPMINIQSNISHDKESNRVYLSHFCKEDFPYIINHIENLAQTNQYTKLFAKIRSCHTPLFIKNGYKIEAYVPNFFNGQEDCFFLVKYKNSERNLLDSVAMDKFQMLFSTPVKEYRETLPEKFTITELKTSDITSMIEVFKKVFKTYPFPIFDSQFIKKSIEEDNTIYFGIWDNHQLVAISSAECNYQEQYAEMTDFAVLPSHRGYHLAIHLLATMEAKLVNKQIKTVYTICRLNSLAMNKTFYNSQYKYTGTLIQNTQISGNIESMNVWYKPLL
ncbi:MAG: putative beta-lysine N-acetyltransferase [Paludibacteraceae bacterium]|nr:putative beta-lysine N-acetyltransferase [Paludibacteraceae bacterium]